MVPAALVELITAGPAILGASSSDDLEPEAFRAWGAFVGDDDRLRVLISSDAVRTHENLRSNGRIAVTFTDVLTFRSLQVKGVVDGPLDPPDRADIAAMRDYHERFCANLLAVGHPRALADRLRPMAVVGAWIRVDELHDQTPGHLAAARLQPEGR